MGKDYWDGGEAAEAAAALAALAETAEASATSPPLAAWCCASSPAYCGEETRKKKPVAMQQVRLEVRAQKVAVDAAPDGASCR